MALPSTLYFCKQSHLLLQQYEILLDYSNHSCFFSSLLITHLSDLVRLNANEKKSAWPPSLFKPTGACWKSSGTSRKRSEPAYWSRGYSVVTLPGYESMGRSKTGIRLGRWPTMHKWRLLFKNCKFKTDPIVCRIASRVADRHHWEF